jgi:hypothetical protein
MSALFLVAAVATSQEIPAGDPEVWKMEETYWRYVKEGDVERYTALLHSDFLGWACETAQPERIATIANWVNDVRVGKRRLTYELKPHGIQRFGSVGLVQYSVRMIWDYPDGKRTNTNDHWKFTHTWLRTPSGWRMLGGMCAKLPAGN